jgi:hypothetical protein
LDERFGENEMTQGIRTIRRGKRSIIIAINKAGTVYHTMIEKDSKRAYIYRDLVESESVINKWLIEGIAANPSDCIPYYG